MTNNRSLGVGKSARAWIKKILFGNFNICQSESILFSSAPRGKAMKELSVILAGIVAWLGCGLMLIMPIMQFFMHFSSINFSSEKIVFMIVFVVVFTIIPAAAFWLFFRMYKNCRNEGLSSFSELYNRLAFPFCIIPIGAIGVTIGITLLLL
jgi:hypothetical protein